MEELDQLFQQANSLRESSRQPSLTREEFAELVRRGAISFLGVQPSSAAIAALDQWSPPTVNLRRPDYSPAYTQANDSNNRAEAEQAGALYDTATAGVPPPPIDPRAEAEQAGALYNTATAGVPPPVEPPSNVDKMKLNPFNGAGAQIASDWLRGSWGVAGNAPTNEAFLRSEAQLAQQAARQREYEAAAAARAAQPEAVRAAMLTETAARGAAEQARTQLGGAAGAGAAALAGAQQAEQARSQMAPQAAQMAQQYRLGEEEKAFQRGQTAQQIEAGRMAEEKERVEAQNSYQRMLQRNREIQRLHSESAAASRQETSDKYDYEEWKRSLPPGDKQFTVTFEYWRDRLGKPKSAPPPGESDRQAGKEGVPGSVSTTQAVDNAGENAQAAADRSAQEQQITTEQPPPAEVATYKLPEGVVFKEIRIPAGKWTSTVTLGGNLTLTPQEVEQILNTKDNDLVQLRSTVNPGSYKLNARATAEMKNDLISKTTALGSDKRIKRNIKPVLSDFDMKMIQKAQSSLMRRFA